MEEIISKTIGLFVQEFKRKSDGGSIEKVSVSMHSDVATIVIITRSPKNEIYFSTLDIENEGAYMYRVRDLVNNLLAQADIEPMSDSIYTDDINRKLNLLAVEIDDLRNRLTAIEK